MNIFEQAIREKVRFSTSQGSLTTEDLFDLTLPKLDILAQALNKNLKDENGVSFISTQTKANKQVQLKFDIVLHIIKTKLEEQDARKTEAARVARREQLKELINQKETAALGDKSVDELRAELASL